MSRTHQWPLTPSSQDSAPSPSKLKENLSIAVPPPNSSLERSRFSPDSPPEQVFSLGRLVLQRSSPRSRRFDPEKGTAGESRSSSTSSQPSIKDRFVRFFVQLRVGRRNDDSAVQRAVPIVAPAPSEATVWRLDNVRGSEPQDARHVHPTCTHKRYSRTLLLALIIFLLYLFVNVIVLNVRTFAPSQTPSRVLSTTPPASPTGAPTSSVMMISADAQQCISQYMLDAPSDPTGYPCDTCLPLLAAVPANATSVYPVARDGTQFCGLRSIWEDAGQQGQAGLEAGGWVESVKFCTWSGVRCNGAGRVSSLYVPPLSHFSPVVFNRHPSAHRQLSFPAIPASLPAQFTNLTDLESLEIVGNGNSPGMTRVVSCWMMFTYQPVAGSFPTNFDALTKFSSLHLENTALGALPTTLQNLTSLTLVRNVQLGSSLPPGTMGSALQSM